MRSDRAANSQAALFLFMLTHGGSSLSTLEMVLQLLHNSSDTCVLQLLLGLGSGLVPIVDDKNAVWFTYPAQFLQEDGGLLDHEEHIQCNHNVRDARLHTTVVSLGEVEAYVIQTMLPHFFVNGLECERA